MRSEKEIREAHGHAVTMALACAVCGVADEAGTAAVVAEDILEWVLGGEGGNFAELLGQLRKIEKAKTQ